MLMAQHDKRAATENCRQVSAPVTIHGKQQNGWAVECLEKDVWSTKYKTDGNGNPIEIYDATQETTQTSPQTSFTQVKPIAKLP